MPGLLSVMLTLGTLMVATQLSLAAAPLAVAGASTAPASAVSAARLYRPR